jgi:hypothetical protein
MLKISPGDSASPYFLEWSYFLAGESATTISTSSWSKISGDVTVGTASISGTRTAVILSAASDATGKVLLRNTIVTANGRTFTRDLQISIEQRKH